METGQCYGNEENYFNMLCPPQSERNRPVVLGRVMMCNMRSPPETIFMSNSVSPLSPEIDPNQAKYISPPGMWNAPGNQIIEE